MKLIKQVSYFLLKKDKTWLIHYNFLCNSFWFFTLTGKQLLKYFIDIYIHIIVRNYENFSQSKQKSHNNWKYIHIDKDKKAELRLNKYIKGAKKITLSSFSHGFLLERSHRVMWHQRFDRKQRKNSYFTKENPNCLDWREFGALAHTL